MCKHNSVSKNKIDNPYASVYYYIQIQDIQALRYVTVTHTDTFTHFRHGYKRDPIQIRNSHRIVLYAEC